MTYEVEIEGRTHLVEVERRDGGWSVRVDGGPVEAVAGARVGQAEWVLRTAYRERPIGVHLRGERAALQIDGHPLTATAIDPRRKALGTSASREGAVVSPMPGVVVRVLVSVGEPVAAGQVLLVVEAMKMENEYRSPVAGRIAEVRVRVGQAIEANTRLVTVEPG